MATMEFEQIRSEALALSKSDRAELAHDLIASLKRSGEPNDDVEWDTKFRTRVSRIDDRTAQFVTRLELKRILRQRGAPKS